MHGIYAIHPTKIQNVYPTFHYTRKVPLSAMMGDLVNVTVITKIYGTREMEATNTIMLRPHSLFDS